MTDLLTHYLTGSVLSDDFGPPEKLSTISLHDMLIGGIHWSCPTANRRNRACYALDVSLVTRASLVRIHSCLTETSVSLLHYLWLEVFCDTRPCIAAHRYQCFGGAWGLDFPGNPRRVVFYAIERGAFFWVIRPSITVYRYQCFGGNGSLLLQYNKRRVVFFWDMRSFITLYR